MRQKSMKSKEPAEKVVRDIPSQDTAAIFV